MKLSKAMRIGFKTTKPRRGIFLTQSQGSACPIGAAAKAVGLAPGILSDIQPKETDREFPVLGHRLGQKRFDSLPLEVRAIYHKSTTVQSLIIQLFDTEKWKRERIADLLESWGL